MFSCITGYMYIFYQIFTMENMENLKSVKSIAESKLKMSLIRNTQSLHNKDMLQTFYKSLQLVCKLKIKDNDFPYFP